MSAKQQRKFHSPSATNASTARAPSRSVLPWLFVLLVIALGTLAYWPAVSGPFILDDYDLLETGGPLRALSYSQLIGPTRPIVMLSYLWNYRLTGFSTSAFHLTNIALHCLNALILWRLMLALFSLGVFPKRIIENKPLFTYGIPLLFLLSPIQTESVAYISSRTELLAVFFFLLGLLSFTVFREARPWLAAALVLLCFVFSVLSKQDKLTLPVVVLLLDYLILSGCDWRGLRKSLPLYGLLVCGIIAGFAVVIRPILFVASAGFNLDWQTYLFTQFRMYFRYLGQLLWPFQLNLDPDIAPSHSLLEQGSVFALIALIMLIAAVVRWHRSAPVLSFGALLFFVALVPTTSFFPLLDFAAERRLYLPSIGFFLVVLSAASFINSQRRNVIGAALAVVLLVYSTAAYQRSITWSDDLLLWQDTASKSPNKSRPRAWLGRVYDQRGLLDQAEAAWVQAEQLAEPDSAEQASLLGNLGLAAARRKSYQEAIDFYERSLLIRQNQPVVRAQQAVALMRLGRTDEAWASFDEAHQNQPVPFEVRVLYAQELYLAGRYAEAVAEYEIASRLFPESADTRNNLEAARQAARRAGQAP